MAQERTIIAHLPTGIAADGVWRQVLRIENRRTRFVQLSIVNLTNDKVYVRARESNDRENFVTFMGFEMTCAGGGQDIGKVVWQKTHMIVEVLAMADGHLIVEEMSPGFAYNS